MPIETSYCSPSWRRSSPVAFTPKGGCPLKRRDLCGQVHRLRQGSIHPQGWVPIETLPPGQIGCRRLPNRSIHPQGWVPIETVSAAVSVVAFIVGSIHPQGWVPIETRVLESGAQSVGAQVVAFTPKGGCPLKRVPRTKVVRSILGKVAFTPKGGCPLKQTARMSAERHASSFFM